MSFLSSGTVSISSGVTSAGLDVVRAGRLRVLNGGRADETEVADGGSAVVSNGGILYVCTVSSGGTVTVLNGGDAERVTVESGGQFLVSSGGATYISYIASGGVMRVYADVTAVSTYVMEGGALYMDVKGHARAPVVSSGGVLSILSQAFILGGRIAGTVYVDGGAANSAWILSGGAVFVMQGGYLFRNTVNSGAAIHISGSGSANSTTVLSGGSCVVSSGGSCYNAGLSGDLDVEAGAKAVNTNVFSGGEMTVQNGGTANSTTVSSGGGMTVQDGGTANSTTVNSGGRMTVLNGGTATEIREAGGWVEIKDGADASFAANTISGLSLGEGQRATVHSGTILEDFTVSSGGTMHVYEGGTLAGTMTLEQGAAVSIEDGGIVAFDLTQTSAGAEALLNDLSVIQGTPLYTLTVNAAADAELTCGTYRYALAGGAAAFDGVISVRRDSGAEPEIISVGDIFFIGTASYLLGILDAVLTLTVIVPDLTPPVVSDVQASTMAPTNQDVTVTASFSDNVELAASFYRIGDGAWLDYVDGVTVKENATVSFKALDAAGNESEIVSFEVTNIDKTAPVIELTGDNTTPLLASTLSATTEAGLDIFYSLDNENWMKYTEPLEITCNGTWFFKAADAVGNTGTSCRVFDNIIITDVVPQKRTWEAVEGAACYIVEYSADDFAHMIRLAVDSNSLDSFQMPEGAYQVRVRPAGGEWTAVEPVVAEEAGREPKLVRSNADGISDVFFANPIGVWEVGYLAQYAGSIDDWSGSNEYASISGKNILADVIEGSADANVLLMTDDPNGDALFLDDFYSALPGSIEEQQSRIARIDEIRAGAGADVIDLTSPCFECTDDGMTVRGGSGGDVIWANKGDNFLFGDEGDDRIVGASGNDVIAGGIGNDRMHGGGGTDVFTFCGNWGTDNVEQLASGTVTLWFASGSDSNWNAEDLTYTDGENSVKVSRVTADRIMLKFGDDGSEEYAKLSAMGAFDAFTSQRIFEESGTGLLADL